MAVTRASQKRGRQEDSSSNYAEYCRQHEQQLQEDRAMIDTYREIWQVKKGFWHAVWRHICDVLWWLEHVCGLNMVDYEEKVMVLLVFAAVLVLILVGAYKQGTQLVHMLQQLVTSRLQQ